MARRRMSILRRRNPCEWHWSTCFQSSELLPMEPTSSSWRTRHHKHSAICDNNFTIVRCVSSRQHFDTRIWLWIVNEFLWNLEDSFNIPANLDRVRRHLQLISKTSWISFKILFKISFKISWTEPKFEFTSKTSSVHVWHFRVLTRPKIFSVWSTYFV